MSTPRASIIIPCYNAEKWIEKCVLSAVNQTYKNKEIIIVDNESTDSSMEILQQKFSYNSDVVIETTKNIFPNCWDEARQKGFSLASGDYLFTLAADDIYSSRFVEKSLSYMLQKPDTVKILQSPIIGIDVEGAVNTSKTSHFYRSIDEFKLKALEKCPVNSPTVVYNREIYDKGLLVTRPEVYGGAADYDLYCQLAERDIFIFPANAFLGYYYRWHPEQATWSVKKEKVDYDALIQEYWKERCI